MNHRLHNAMTVSLLLLMLSSCSGEVERNSNPTGPSGEILFQRLLVFQEQIDRSIDKFYAGISFNEYEAFLGNLTVYIVDRENTQETRDALIDVFGQQGKEVPIQVWDNASTVADEELKRSLVFEDSSGLVSLDYDERIDRLVIEVDSVDVVTRYENYTLSQLNVERNVLSVELGLPPEVGEVKSTAAGRRLDPTARR